MLYILSKKLSKCKSQPWKTLENHPQILKSSHYHIIPFSQPPFLNPPVAFPGRLPPPVFPPPDVGPQPFMEVIEHEFQKDIHKSDDGNGAQYIAVGRFGGLRENDKADDEGGAGGHDAPADGLQNAAGRTVFLNNLVSLGHFLFHQSDGDMFIYKEVIKVSNFGTDCSLC